ncbi:hypothetical protein CAL7716_031760 [Calothrix sp. PCC 7716]|nr:hypothetical protein CAL7716_031760 [Calothrix sp. PCC 7716]
MPTITSTRSITKSIRQILENTNEGKTQLPDFQRSWVWNDEQICSLLASISLSYPIGAVMMLETGNPAVKFKYRVLEGVSLGTIPTPESLILDGQQRITSLFQVLFSSNLVKTRETRLAKDLQEVLAWVNDGSEPDTITSANFAPGRLLSLRTRNSAAYKGLFALLLHNGSVDFRTGCPIDTEIYFDDKIDIHHIFPQHWCKEQGIDAKLWDCILNKTPISARTNRMIGGKAPSIYLPKVQNEAGVTQAHIDEFLQTHLIDPKLLRQDDFENFLNARKKSILERIEKAMGKSCLYNINAEQEAEANYIDLVEYDEELNDYICL